VEILSHILLAMLCRFSIRHL